MESVRLCAACVFVAGKRMEAPESFLKIEKKVNQLEHDHTHKCNHSVSIPSWVGEYQETVLTTACPSVGRPLGNGVQSSSAASTEPACAFRSRNRKVEGWWNFITSGDDLLAGFASSELGSLL